MSDLGKIKIGTPVVAGMSLLLAAIWCVSAGLVLHYGMGKQLPHFTLLWMLDFFFFGPVLSTAISALMIYGYFKRPESRSILSMVAIILGFVPLAGFVAFVLVAFVRDVFGGP